MQKEILIAFSAYFLLLVLIGLLAYKKQAKSSGSITSSRSLGYWVTAISAHASDMSSWLFMGLPAAVFLTGVFQFWAAVGLTLFMFLNWQFIAKKLRQETERYGCFSLSGFFGFRFDTPTGSLHWISSVMALVFFTCYVAAGFVGMGLLFESVFAIPYSVGICVGISVVVVYTFVGGYVAVAWTDFFQGLFLLVVIVVVPLFAVYYVGGVDVVWASIQEKGLSLALFPSFTFSTFFDIFILVVGWGLGYFGQPHILSKFMGIKNPKDMHKSKYIGTCWQIITLCAATAVGLVAVAFFKEGTPNPDLLFVKMVQILFHPLIAGFVLCAILAATISTIDSQILVLANLLTEDFYQRSLRKNASPQELRLVSRVSIVLIAVLAFFVAYLFNYSVSIYYLVLFSWTGLGCSFGPLLLFALYSKRVNAQGAIAGILSGGLVAAFWTWLLWPQLQSMLPFSWVQRDIPAMIPGFLFSSLMILLFSALGRSKKKSLKS